MKTWYLILSALFACLASAQAQTNDTEARVAYMEAMNAYGNGQFSSALSSLEKVKKLLGATNPRVEYLLAKTYFEIRDFTAAESHIGEYFKLAAEDDANYNEMVMLVVNIKQEKERIEQERIRAEQKRKENERQLQAKLEAQRKEESERAAARRQEEQRQLEAYKKEQETWNSAKSKNSIKWYKFYLSQYPNGIYNMMAQKKIHILKGKFIMYAYENERPLGLSFGALNHNRISFYFNFRVNKDIFTATSYGGINDANQIDCDHCGYYVDTKESKYGRLAASAGIAFKIRYPVWIYLGAGVSKSQLFEKVVYDEDYWEFTKEPDLVEVWMANSDHKKITSFPELGLQVKIANILILKYGVYRIDKFAHQFGIGFRI